MRSLASLLVLLLLAPLTSAQTAEDILLLSRRQATLGADVAGQGGAVIGGVGGWTSSLANPANLGWLRTSQLSLAVDLSGIESDALYQLDPAEAEAGFGSTTFDGSTRSSGARLDHVGYAAKVPTVRGSFVVGLGYNRTSSYDRALFYDAEVTGTRNDATSFTDRFEEDLFEEGQGGEFSAVAAIEAAPGVMIGGAINVLFGSYFIESTAQASFFERNPDVFSFDLDTRGVNARLGVSAEAQPGLRFGVVVETPTYVAVREQGLDDFSTVLPLEYDYTTPWRFGAGAVYEIAGATLAADVEYVDWSQARFRDEEFFTSDGIVTLASENARIRRTFDDAFTTRFGAAYDFGAVVARLGLAYQPDPLREDQGIVADRLRRTITAGIGVRVGRNAHANAAVLHTQFEDQLVAVDGVGLILEDVARTSLVVGVTLGF
ncbi:MAG: hypothetical protein AAGG50_10490 [Bacteroidota bacterium]